MPRIEIDSNDRRRVDELVRFTRQFFLELPAAARMVFAVEMARLLKPEFQELKRRVQADYSETDENRGTS